MHDNPAQLAEFFEYVKWADLKQLEQADSLDDDAYLKAHGFSYGNVHGLLLHMVAAHDAWLGRFRGEPPRWIARDDVMKPRASVRTKWAQVHAEFSQYLASLDRTALERKISYVNTLGEAHDAPLGRLLMHVMNHSTIHRAQLNSMLKLSGISPKPVDYTSWYFGRGPITN